MSWYERYIEEPVRPLVKLLRDNGFNTEDSCGHEMTIQCQYAGDGEIYELHRLLTSYGYLNFDIDLKWRTRCIRPIGGSIVITIEPKNSVCIKNLQTEAVNDEKADG